MGYKEERTYCSLDTAGAELLKMAMSKACPPKFHHVGGHGLSVCAYDRIVKVSRTIADIQ